MSQADSRIICPVCQRPNPPGRYFCQHCWGAIIVSGNSVPAGSAEEVSRYRLSRIKHRKKTRVLAISLVSLAVLVSIVFPVLYYSTDLVVKPLQGLSSNSPPGEWAMFRYDLGHTGASSSTAGLPQGKLKWVFPTGSAIHSSPAVANGAVYFGSINGKLYALDAATGAKRWEYTARSWVESSPAVAYGKVYFGSNDGKLYALDAINGEKLWDFPTGYPVMSSPAVAQGVVYFGSDNYHLYALDMVKGEKLWDFDTDGLVKSSPVVANGIVYVGSTSDFSYALNASNGRLRLRFKTIYPVFSSPAIGDGTIYLATSNGFLFAVDSNARTRFREHAIKPYWTQLWLMGLPLVPSPPPQSGFLWGMRLGKEMTSSPVVAGDTLYIASGKNLVAIDLKTQQKRWEFQAKGKIRSSPAILSNVIYAGSEDGYLYALKADTGEKLWEFFIGAEITSSPAIVDGTIYVGAQDGNLYAIN